MDNQEYPFEFLDRWCWKTAVTVLIVLGVTLWLNALQGRF